LWLVLLACLRGAGLSQAQVSWQASLAAFAFVRLLTVLPVTPGGLGITELGLVGILAAGAGHRVTVHVVAAVLAYRALTYLLPIPLGATAGLAWQHLPALSHGPPGQPSQPNRSGRALVAGGTGHELAQEPVEGGSLIWGQPAEGLGEHAVEDLPACLAELGALGGKAVPHRPARAGYPLDEPPRLHAGG
jgi:hypothetical protein